LQPASDKINNNVVVGGFDDHISQLTDFEPVVVKNIPVRKISAIKRPLKAIEEEAAAPKKRGRKTNETPKVVSPAAVPPQANPR
jgi:hypothetical protein